MPLEAPVTSTTFPMRVGSAAANAAPGGAGHYLHRGRGGPPCERGARGRRAPDADRAARLRGRAARSGIRKGGVPRCPHRVAGAPPSGGSTPGGGGEGRGGHAGGAGRIRRLGARAQRSEEHTSELQSPCNLVCRLLLEKKKKKHTYAQHA